MRFALIVRVVKGCDLFTVEKSPTNVVKLHVVEKCKVFSDSLDETSSAIVTAVRLLPTLMEILVNVYRSCHKALEKAKTL